jgi:hypothetical protein
MRTRAISAILPESSNLAMLIYKSMYHEILSKVEVCTGVNNYHQHTHWYTHIIPEYCPEAGPQMLHLHKLNLNAISRSCRQLVDTVLYVLVTSIYNLVYHRYLKVYVCVCVCVKVHT